MDSAGPHAPNSGKPNRFYHFDVMSRRGEEKEFQESILGKYLNETEDQLAILNALINCGKIVPLEDYLIGYFIPGNLNFVEREKRSVKSIIQGTKARLSANVDPSNMSDLLSQSRGKKHRVFHFAMHNSKLKKKFSTNLFIVQYCSHIHHASTLVMGSDKTLHIV